MRLVGLRHPCLLSSGINLAVCSDYASCLILVFGLVVSGFQKDWQVKFNLPEKEGFGITRISNDHELFLKVDHSERAAAFLNIKVGLLFEFFLQALECYFYDFLEVLGLNFLRF